MITMQDIADSLNISRGTVSYVLSGKHQKAKISETRRQQILEAAEKLGYRRNLLATSVKTGRTNMIGIAGGLYSSYGMEMINGINEVAVNNNYLVKILPVDSKETGLRTARLIVEHRLDGVICQCMGESKLKTLYTELSKFNIPMVQLDTSFQHDWCSRVVSDDYNGSKLATEYLIKMGHRRIAHITAPITFGFASLRYSGFQAALKSTATAGVEGKLFEDTTHFELNDEFEKNFAVFYNDFNPTAVFCGSDPIAMKVIAVANSMGLNIPGDLSVIGYGGLEYTSISSPPMTTIRQNFTEMGKTAAKILLEEITGNSKPHQHFVPVELVERKSTADLNHIE